MGKTSVLLPLGRLMLGLANLRFDLTWARTYRRLLLKDLKKLPQGLTVPGGTSPHDSFDAWRQRGH